MSTLITLKWSKIVIYIFSDCPSGIADSGCFEFTAPISITDANEGSDRYYNFCYRLMILYKYVPGFFTLYLFFSNPQYSSNGTLIGYQSMLRAGYEADKDRLV